MSYLQILALINNLEITWPKHLSPWTRTESRTGVQLQAWTGVTYKEYSGRGVALRRGSKALGRGGSLLPWLVHSSLADRESGKDTLYLTMSCRPAQIHRLLDYPPKRKIKTHNIGPLCLAKRLLYSI